MSSLVLTLTETLRYRGAVGQWSWVLHRLTGLGVLFFLYLHVIDTSWSVFYPALYEKAIAIYQSPLFTLGEFGLVFAVVYHAYNGIRIAVFDFKPEWWRHQQKAAVGVLGITLLTLIPVFILMFSHVMDHYEGDPFILPLDEILVEQIPFLVGIVVAVVGAVIFSGIAGVLTGNTEVRGKRSRIEQFWWSFMRVSGVLILPLVFGHLALVHVIQGVFDITAAGYTTVGTDLVNQTGTAVEFVGNRWNFLLGSVAVWKLYDIGLLSLVTAHGFNGLRYVLTDYTSGSPILRRAMIYLCVMGAVALLLVGAGALLGSIDSEAIMMAVESQCKLGMEVAACN